MRDKFVIMTVEQTKTPASDGLDTKRNESPDELPKTEAPTGPVLHGEVLSEPEYEHTDSAQQLHTAVLKSGEIISKLVRGADEETKDMVREILNEKLEREQIQARSRTDATIFEALRQQVGHLNDSLSDFQGKPTTIIEYYQNESRKDPEKYPPLNTAGGFRGIIRLHQELYIATASAPKKASELAEAEANKAIIPAKKEVAILKIESDKEIADTFADSAESLKRASREHAEVRVQQVRGVATVVATAVGETPVILAHAPAAKVGEYIDRSNDKPATILGFGGALAGPFVLIIYGPTLSPVLAAWITNAPWGTLSAAGVGIVTGGVAGFLGWKAARYSAEFVWAKISEVAQTVGEKASQLKENASKLFRNGK